jgi:cytochrome c peroxidase
VSCHQGINIGGNMLQRLGVMRDYFADRGDIKPADMGLYVATKRDEDRHVFRVPSLRNVALTAPYFHDASAATLPEAVTTMARYQLGRELGEEQKSQIVAFLGTLTGELHGRPL